MGCCCAGVRYAVYALVCGIVYVVGFPLAVFVLLFRRRHKLFGDGSDPFVATTRAKYGFLYEVRWQWCSAHIHAHVWTVKGT